MTKPKDIIIDFINYVFGIVVSVSFFFYFIVGDHFFYFYKIVKAIAFTSIFFIPFIIKFNFAHQKIKKMEKEDTLLETMTYITEADKRRDIIVAIFLPISIFMFSYFNKYLGTGEWLEAIFSFLFYWGWHLWLLRRRDNLEGIINLTNFDEMKDEIFLFLLPIIIATIALYFNSFNIIIFFQVISVFVIAYIGHKLLFRSK